jgi:FMN phosphatase YigB (HAD superfamily)
VLTPDSYQALKRGVNFYGDWPKQGQLAVMVGDNYADDVETQGQRGLRTVWKVPHLAHEPTFANSDPLERARLYAYRKHQTARADAIILSLRELPDVVEQWEARLPR